MNSRTETLNDRDPVLVRSVFQRIAGRYDLANHLLSGGFDFWWRARVSRLVQEWRPRDLLDLATGSGDLALAIARRSPDTRIVGADFCAEMLEHARRKGVAETVVADALALPFAGESFDAVTVAFGLRNMASWDGALREMSRVLRPGSHVAILDFSLPPSAPVRAVYRAYLHRVLPLLATAVTGEKEAYTYLAESIERFPCGDQMLALIAGNGFEQARVTRMTAGIVSLYTALKKATG